MELTREQKHFFETFGYLALPGLLKNDIAWITEEFEAVFQGHNVSHDGSERSCIVPFIDQRKRLSTLLDHPKLVGLISSVLGEEFNYLGGDGNFYNRRHPLAQRWLPSCRQVLEGRLVSG